MLDPTRPGAPANLPHPAPEPAERWSHSRGLGYLEQAVRNVLSRNTLSAHSARELAEALAEVDAHCPSGE